MEGNDKDQIQYSAYFWPEGRSMQLRRGTQTDFN